MSARQRAAACPRTILVEERASPPSPMPVGLEPALQTAPLEEPGPARRVTSIVRASGMETLLQALLRVKARPSRRRPPVVHDRRQRGPAALPEQPPPVAEQPWG